MPRDLETMSVAELDALIERARIVRQENRDRRRFELKDEIEGKLKSEGFSAIEVLALVALWQSSASHAAPWRVVALIAPLYLGGILFAIRRPRSERFYEWWVEGILFLPALAVLASRA